MSLDFTLNAEPRSEHGKNACRRLRKMGKVPAVIYGGGEDATTVALDHDSLAHDLEQEAIFSHVLTINCDGKSHKAILRDLQRHPFKNSILHIDLQRVREDTEISVNVPIHFLNEDECPGVKLGKGIVSHVMVDVEVECLPKNLPEFLELDLIELEIGDVLKLSDIKLPEGVTIPELEHEEDEEHDYDAIVVSVQPPTVEEVDQPVEAEAAEGEVVAEGEAEEGEAQPKAEGEEKSEGDKS